MNNDHYTRNATCTLASVLLWVAAVIMVVVLLTVGCQEDCDPYVKPKPWRVIDIQSEGFSDLTGIVYTDELIGCDTLVRTYFITDWTEPVHTGQGSFPFQFTITIVQER